jgi:hypothetical protein
MEHINPSHTWIPTISLSCKYPVQPILLHLHTHLQHSKLPARSITHSRCKSATLYHASKLHLSILHEDIVSPHQNNLPDDHRSYYDTFSSPNIYPNYTPNNHGHRPSDDVELPEHPEIREHDDDLDDDIARMVDNAHVRHDGWVVPIAQEDMTGMYEALAQMGKEATVNKEEDEDEGEVDARGLQVKDVVCKCFGRRALDAFDAETGDANVLEVVLSSA